MRQERWVWERSRGAPLRLSACSRPCRQKGTAADAGCESRKGSHPHTGSEPDRAQLYNQRLQFIAGKRSRHSNDRERIRQHINEATKAWKKILHREKRSRGIVDRRTEATAAITFRAAMRTPCTPSRTGLRIRRQRHARRLAQQRNRQLFYLCYGNSFQRADDRHFVHAGGKGDEPLLHKQLVDDPLLPCA